MKHICHIILALTITTSALILMGCQGGTRWQRAEGSVWNTLYSIDYLSNRSLDDSIQAAMREVELSLSAFNPESTVTRVNRSTTPVEIDSMFAEVFRAAAKINAKSNGLFDPTVSPLINLWGFGYKGSADTVPSPESIADALTSVGILQCRIADGMIYKKSPATEFNFSAIAKGYGCDRVAAMLRRNGCNDYKVEIGGEIALNGHNRRGTDWRIMIDAPIECDTIHHENFGIVELSKGGIATSGSYRNYRDTPEGRRSHTINPATGYPMEHDVTTTRQVSATVIAPTCMEADGLATACMAMDAKSALRMIEEYPGAEALLVIPDSVGTWQTLRTSGFPELTR